MFTVFQELSSKVSRYHQISTTIGDLSPRLRRSASPTNWTIYDYQNHSFETIFEMDDELDGICTKLYFLLDFCHLYYIPSIILLGLVGNLLSCVVFLKTHLKLRSSSYYLAALATADFGFLMSLLLVWLNSTVGWRVFNNDGWCETLVYISAVCSSLSVWLIVAFTVERFIAVQYPLHRPHMCTVARAKTIILVLTFFALASHSYCFVTAGVIRNQDGDEMCDLRIEYLEIMRIISIIDSIASLIVPLVLIIVMNIMIMRNLLEFGRRFNQEQPGTANCVNREKADINLNRIPLSFCFSYVIRLCVFFFTLARKNTPETLWCLQQFFMLLYYTNFSINFLLYAMCGITFRRCLEQILRRIMKSMTLYHCNSQREPISP
ncbi:hypothetical protein ACFW04_011047 [Cataglyphis niger]